MPPDPDIAVPISRLPKSSPIVPVVDVRRGLAVHAVAGEREKYRPWLDEAGEPYTPQRLAERFARIWRPRWLYVADLDGIIENRPCQEAWPRLAGDATRILIDAGFRHADHVQAAHRLGYDTILGTESMLSAEGLEGVVRRVEDFERLWISLDFRSGVWKAPPELRERGLEGFIDDLAAWGIRRWIVLDLADVGCATGGSTRAKIMTLRGRLAALKSTALKRESLILAGGGMRTAGDVKRLQGSGVDGVLVATALMSGGISPDEF